MSESESFPFSSLHFVYMVQCRDGTLYTGYTPSLCTRIEKHNQKKGARYTKSRTPVSLVYFELFLDKRQAMSREWHLKQLSRAQKLALTASMPPFCLVSLKLAVH